MWQILVIIGKVTSEIKWQKKKERNKLQEHNIRLARLAIAASRPNNEKYKKNSLSKLFNLIVMKAV